MRTLIVGMLLTLATPSLALAIVPHGTYGYKARSKRDAKKTAKRLKRHLRKLAKQQHAGATRDTVRVNRRGTRLRVVVQNPDGRGAGQGLLSAASKFLQDVSGVQPEQIGRQQRAEWFPVPLYTSHNKGEGFEWGYEGRKGQPGKRPVNLFK